MIHRIFILIALLILGAPAPAMAAPDPAEVCEAKPGWNWDANKARCVKDAAYWKAKRGEKPCRAAPAPRWSSCRADAPTMPQTPHGASVVLTDTKGPWTGSKTIVCQYGVYKDAKALDGSRNRGTCSRH